MKVDVFTPDDNVGDVIGDLNRRRSIIKSQEANPTGVRVKAECPLSEMFGYIGTLRTCLLYTSPSPRDPKTSRMPSSA